MAGWYKLTAIRPDGRERPLTGWFPNLITNGGLDRMATGPVGFHVHVGAGNTPPDANDTALAASVARTSTTQLLQNGAQGAAPYYGWYLTTWRFSQGAAAGNLAEVGVGWSNTNGDLFSRALILDGGGSPTTVTVLADEFLDVSYELRNYPSLTDSDPHIVSIGGVDYTFTARSASVTDSSNWTPPLRSGPSYPNTGFCRAYNGGIQAITQQPSGAGSNSSSISAAAYSNGSREIASNAEWGLNNGNVSGGITALDFRRVNHFGYQFSVSPAIPKDNEKTLALTMVAGWDRKDLTA